MLVIKSTTYDKVSIMRASVSGMANDTVEAPIRFCREKPNVDISKGS